MLKRAANWAKIVALKPSHLCQRADNFGFVSLFPKQYSKLYKSPSKSSSKSLSESPSESPSDSPNESV